MDPADIAARALANMDESLYEIDEEISATYNTDDNSAKRMKRDNLPKVPKPKPIQPPPSSLIVSFKNQEGTPSFRQVVALYLSVNVHADLYLDCVNDKHHLRSNENSPSLKSGYTAKEHLEIVLLASSNNLVRS